MRTHRAPAWLAAVALAVTVAGCSGGGTGDGGTPTAEPSRLATTTAPVTPSSSPPSSGTTGATTDLAWQPVAGPVRDEVTAGGGWTLTVTGNGAGWQLAGPGEKSHGSTPGFRVSDALLDEHWAVVVLQDRQEQQPSRARVTDLTNGQVLTIDGHADVPTTNGGTWALVGDRLLHATVHRGAYCLASVDLASRTSTLGWCAPKRHGFNGAHVAPGGESVLSFDSGRPSCRTLIALDGS